MVIMCDTDLIRWEGCDEVGAQTFAGVLVYFNQYVPFLRRCAVRDGDSAEEDLAARAV